MILKNPLRKEIFIHRYTVGAVALLVLAMLIRVTLLLLGWPASNSDEAMTDLAALHIEKLGEHPIFMYGQYYLGQFATYIGSVLFRIVDPSSQVIRLELIVFTAIFFGCIYFLTSRLYTKRFALFMLVLLCLGSQWTINNQIMADGYPETPLVAGLLCLVAYIVASHYFSLSTGKRCLLYLLWGILAGLALWTQLLTVPYILVSGLMIVVLCWPEFFKRASWFIVLGLVIGGFPLIYYNLTAAPGLDSFHTYLALSHMGVVANDNVFKHIERGVLVTIPISTGYASRCVVNVGPNDFFDQSWLCTTVGGLWGIGYLVVLVLALIVAAISLRKACRIDDPGERHLEKVQQFTRLMFLCGAMLSIIFFIQGNAVNISASESQRYLICDTIALPSILWLIWTCERWLKPAWLYASAQAFKVGVLLLFCLALFYSTFLIFRHDVPAARTDQRQLVSLEQKLEELHITRFYSTYWTCGRIIFETQEQLICSNTYPDLSPGSDRYLPYRRIVEADPHPGFVYADGSPEIVTLESYLTRYHLKYERIKIDGYVIYKMYEKIPAMT